MGLLTTYYLLLTTYYLLLTTYYLPLEQYDGALIELRTLVEVAPKEGSVYFVLGKVYKKLGQPSQAMVNLTRALDLSPKDAQQIKAAILNLEREDNADEQEEY